jgi:rhodanese-related sulfurtransferase
VTDDVPAIDTEELAARLDAGAVLIDVRQPDEFEEFHVPGARLIPLDELPDRLHEIPEDRTVYAICRTGGRSSRAVRFLNANGFDAVNVAGGSLGWVDSGRPTEHGQHGQ